VIRIPFGSQIQIQVLNQDQNPNSESGSGSRRAKKLGKANNVLKSGMFSWSSAIVVDVLEENIAIFQIIKKRTFTKVLVTRNLRSGSGKIQRKWIRNQGELRTVLAWSLFAKGSGYQKQVY
jgi:hypothetical protein